MGLNCLKEFFLLFVFDPTQFLKVDFSLFKSLAGDFYPQVTLQEAIKEIYNGLKKIKFKDKSFRNSNLMRLRMLQTHIKRNKINDNLEWK